MVLIFLDIVNSKSRQNLFYPENGNACDEAVLMLITMIAGMVVMMMTMMMIRVSVVTMMIIRVSVVKVMMMVNKKKCAEAQRKWIRQSGRSRAELR